MIDKIKCSLYDAQSMTIIYSVLSQYVLVKHDLARE